MSCRYCGGASETLICPLCKFIMRGLPGEVFVDLCKRVAAHDARVSDGPEINVISHEHAIAVCEPIFERTQVFEDVRSKLLFALWTSAGDRNLIRDLCAMDPEPPNSHTYHYTT